MNYYSFNKSIMGQCICFLPENSQTQQATGATAGATTCAGATASIEMQPDITRVALKFPHGVNGAHFSRLREKFINCNINEWLADLYKGSLWTHWVAYNDEIPDLEKTNEDTHDNKHTAGHCKGIVAWNASRLSWLCHSVPKFPSKFNGNFISIIEESETIYGQSFHYTEVALSEKVTAVKVLKQLLIMHANVYLTSPNLPSNKLVPMILLLSPVGATTLEVNNGFGTMFLTPDIFHIAKPPKLHLDIYEELAKLATLDVKTKSKWYIETWIRGHHLEKNDQQMSTCLDITELQLNSVSWKSSQDHSKWAVSGQGEKFYFMGDLNRMSSQLSRGGGGMLCEDEQLANALFAMIRGWDGLKHIET